MTKTRNKLKIMGLVLTLLLVLGVMPLMSITADAAYTTQIAPFNTTITVNCKCGKDAGVAEAVSVSYSKNGATMTYDIKVEWWCSACYKNYSYTCSGISVTCDDCEKGTSVTVTENLSDGTTISFKFWRDAGEHNSDDITTTPATCISTGEKRVDNCYYCGLTKTLETYPIDAKNHSFVNGFCELCGAELHVCSSYDNGFCTEYGCYEPAELKDGYYQIKNAGQLFWFANHVNTVDRTASAVLVADIDLENRPWTSIGETGENNKNFRGVFDGQNHTIKGLYVEGTQNGVGFFGEVRTGTVKNFTIYGEVIVNTEVDYVGGVIGSICGVNGETDLERNGAIIQNITSYVNLTAKAHGVGMIGGFVGYANHQSLIENCSWYGTFDAGIYRVDSGAGGFIGKIQENTSEVTIRNCAAYGTIKTNYAGDYNNTATIYMGGFLSFSNTGAKTTLENCLFAGKFECGENLTDQAFLGAFGTLRSVNAIKNCYYLGDDGLEAVHSNSDLKPGSDNVEITSVTKAQLLSGEVAYKLGEHFGQILEGENRQSYPVLGGTKVEDSQRFEIYGQQLNIGGDLSMKYYVMGYAPEFNSKGLYMEFSHNGVKTKVYADEPNDDGFYVFILEGINPQCMGDSIRAMLCYNETEVASHGFEDGKEYSVEKNLLNLLEKYKDDAALVALINDTLAYGKAASEYKKHDTMTGDYTVSDSTIPDATVTPNGAFTGYTVVFGQVNFIKVSVTLETGYTLYLDGTDITTQLVDGIFKTDGIAPTEFDQKFTFEIKNGDTVVQTFAVSVNDYIGAQKDSTTMGNLVKALYNYGVSAEIYNHVANGVGEHTYTYIDNGGGTHDKVCTICSNVNNEAHDYVNGKCVCGKYEVTIDLSTLNATYVINDNKYYEFIGSGNYGIKVESGNPTIVLNDASITVGEGSAIDVASGSNATIFVLGDNTIGTTKTESWDAPCGGIFVAEDGTVNITSNGTNNILRARGTLAAAIGGKYDYDNDESYNAGSINISNVTVYAYTNNFYASAIGAAGEGTCGTINITNAVVYVYGAGDQWTSAPGIGSAWRLVGGSDTIPVVIISDSEVHTFRHNSGSDYIGYLGDVEMPTNATGSINCGEGGSVTNSTIYCYTGLDATTTDKVVIYDADGNPTENQN